jgi:hypothetical protein
MFADKISELENRDDATKMALFCCEVFSTFDAPEYWYAFIVACGLDPRDGVFSPHTEPARHRERMDALAERLQGSKAKTSPRYVRGKLETLRETPEASKFVAERDAETLSGLIAHTAEEKKALESEHEARETLSGLQSESYQGYRKALRDIAEAKPAETIRSHLEKEHRANRKPAEPVPFKRNHPLT